MTEKEALDIGLRAAYGAAKIKAVNSGLEFSLSYRLFCKLSLGKCTFCKEPGATPVTNHHKRLRIGQLNRLKGLTDANAIPICRTCWWIKKGIAQNHISRVLSIAKKLKRTLEQ